MKIDPTPSHGNSSRKELYPTVSQLLDGELVEAINNGDPALIADALQRQECNPLTEAISNRFIVRSFLIGQRAMLASVESEMSTVGTAAEAIELIRHYLHELKIAFAATFVSRGSDGSESYNLSGDDHFREAFDISDDDSMRTARSVLSVDVEMLTSPQAVFNWMKSVSNGITDSLWEEVQLLREQDFSQDALTNTRLAMGSQIDRIDRLIEGSLPKE